MRSISKIYSEIVATRNNYLQLTELDSGRSNSKLSIINLLSYIVAVAIHSYETVLDLFQLRLTEVLVGRVNGTPDWYVHMAKKFQYNPVTMAGDEMRFNENTMKIEYVVPDPNRRIITKSAWQTQNTDGSLLLKVSKTNNENNQKQGVPYIPLTTPELTAFRNYIQNIKFVGAVIYCESMPGDVLRVIATEESPIYYDDRYITANQALLNIQNALIEYVNTANYNDILYYQDIIDVIQKAEHISAISKDIKITLTAYNYLENHYEAPEELISRARLKSGYIQLLDERGETTVNASNIILKPASQSNMYII